MAAGATEGSEPASGEGVFQAAPAAYSDPLVATAADAGFLRTLSVEERAGAPRHQALVRVPLFFAEKECPDLSELAIVPATGDDRGAPVVWQADDIRRGPDGGIARVHLWFAVDLAAGEKRQYRLIRRRAAAPAKTPALIPITVVGGSLRIDTGAGPYEFSRTGGLRTVPGAGGGWKFAGEGLGPEVVVGFGATPQRPARHVTFGEAAGARRVEFASGPLFAKVRINFKDEDGAALEQEYRIPRDGRELVLTEALFPGRTGMVRQNHLLVGRPAGSASPAWRRIPAGIRYALRAEQAYTVSGIGPADATLLAIPLVLGGTNGQWSVERDGRVVLEGQGGLQRGGEGEKDTLYGYWTEVRLVPVGSVRPDDDWRAYREHVQPLVAVVDEPGASIERLHAALAGLMGEMKPIGWRQEAGRALALGETGRLAHLLQAVSPAKEGDAPSLVRGAEYDTAKITQNGKRRLREDEKGRAYGRLDPYHITYTQSAAAAVVALADAPPTITTVNYAMAKGVRDFGGHADAAGFPYIDCFSRTLNMQLGPVLFGLTAGAREGDAALVAFYRDLATAPPVQGIFGRGQRPYTGAPTTSADQTDFLYQSICDFWLRTSELLAGEDLHLHPLAYGRYTDCTDVMADRYHGVAAKDKPGAAGEARANFYRGQAHTHRWLGWSAAPFIRLLQDPAEHASVGLTEAIRYARTMKGRWKNWPDLTLYELADLLVREGLPRYQRPSRLPEVGVVTATPQVAGADLSWPAVPGATAYRIYRAEHAGGPYTWVNSPYLPSPLPAVTQPRFHDSGAKPDSAFVVIATDAAGRQSDWPEDAPRR